MAQGDSRPAAAALVLAVLVGSSSWVALRFIALLFFAWLWGIWGLLIDPPLVAIVSANGSLRSTLRGPSQQQTFDRHR